jgi:hypothetical protein
MGLFYSLDQGVSQSFDVRDARQEHDEKPKISLSHDPIERYKSQTDQSSCWRLTGLEIIVQSFIDVLAIVVENEVGNTFTVLPSTRSSIHLTTLENITLTRISII